MSSSGASLVFTIDEIKNRLTPILQNFDVKSAILFGSYAKGTANPRSDVDLVVDTDLRGLKFMDLYCEVQDALDGIDLDMFATREVKPGGRADSEIKRWGLVIYQA